MFNKKQILSVLPMIGSALLFSQAAYGQAAPEDVEGVVGTKAGTYIDLTNDVAGTTRNGITGIWNTPTGWGFPDSSDSAVTVNGNVADSKSNDTTPIQMDFSGLVPNQVYDVFAVLAQNPSNSGPYGFSWSDTDASQLTEIRGDNHLGGGQKDYQVPFDGTNLELQAVFLSALTADASGNLTVFIGGADGQRTEFDGILLDVLPDVLGDITGDGQVTVADYQIVRDNFGTGTIFDEGDVNFDGKVDLKDYIIIDQEFPKYNGGASLASAIPEPTSIALLTIAGLTTLRRRK